MTKALVLTHHSVPNFGANLQALATSQALAERGVSAQYVDFRPPELEAKYEASVPEAQRLAHAAFCSRYLSLTPLVKDHAAFEAFCLKSPADLYITGSDAVFRLENGNARADLSFPNPYWLVGAEGIDGERPRRIAVAPSAMGCDLAALPQGTRARLATALAGFDALSVRDRWTARQLRRLGANPTIVPDPVFSLLPRIRKIRAARPKCRPYVIICTQGRYDQTWVETFTQLADQAGFDTLALPTPEGVCDEGTTRRAELPIDPMDWLALIACSDGYVGNRFHPVVVALTAGVPTVALDLYHRSPLSRGRSKTWLIMREFGCSSACHSRAVQRLLTPKFVWRQLRAQDRWAEARLRTGEAMAARVADWFNKAVGPTREVAV